MKIQIMHEIIHGGRKATCQLYFSKFGKLPDSKILERIVSECPICQKFQKKVKREELSFIEPSGVGSHVGVDFVGPLRKNKFGQRFLMMMTDYISRYSEVSTTKKITTEVAILGLKECEKKFNRPITVVADFGPAFRAENFRMYCHNKNIKLHLMSAYNHKGNRLVERNIQSLNKKIDKMILEKKCEWDEALRSAIKMYNHSWNSIALATPMELMEGMTPFGDKLDNHKREKKIKTSLDNLKLQRQR